VLADLAAQILPLDLDRDTTRPHDRRPDRRVERQVVVARTGEAVTRVPTAAATDEGSSPAAEAGTLDAVDAPPLSEHLRRIDPQSLHLERPVGRRVRVER
jgi:hypothetical protein